MASSARIGGPRQVRPPADRQEVRRQGRIVSQAPGRVRVRLHQEFRDPAVLKQVEEELRGRDGVTAVATDARTGSILVHYDCFALATNDLRDLLFDVGIVPGNVAGAEGVPEEHGREGARRDVAPHSSGATGVLDALTDLDHRISRLTGGRLDLKLLVPVGLGLLAMRQIALNGLGLAHVPGYVLLWYTFDTFYKLHQRKAVAAIQEAAEGIMGDGPDTGSDV
jgi:hypothetical protein